MLEVPSGFSHHVPLNHCFPKRAILKIFAYNFIHTEPSIVKTHESKKFRVKIFVSKTSLW